jgi:hypothetical protein
LLLLPALPLHAADFKLELLMQGLAAEKHPPRHFTESRHSELLFAPVTLQGTLAFVDDQLIKHITQPFDERFIVSGETLRIERDGSEATPPLSLAEHPPLFNFVTIFRASLQGDLKTLQQHYQTSFSGNAQAWQLQLQPREARLSVYLKGVEITGSGNTIMRFTIEEQNGDSSTLELGESAP